MIVVFRGPVSRSERVAIVLALGVTLALVLPLWGTVTDTTFVWLQYAFHLARGGGLVFNPGERVYACTNPLWVALLGDATGLGLDPLVFAKIVGTLAALASVAMFLQLMRRTVRMPALRAIATVVYASQAWVAAYAANGLETTLAMALVLAGFVALTEGADWGDRPVRTGALWALAALTRPGAVLLVVLWGTALLADAQNRPGLRRLVFGAAPAAAIYGAWMLFARVYFGSFWPRVLSLAPVASAGTSAWFHRLVTEVSPLAATEGALVITGIVAFVLSPWPHVNRDRGALRLLPLAWVVALPALFAARGLDAGPRHLLILTPIVHALVWQAIDRWGATRGRALTPGRMAALAAALGAVVVAQNLVAYQSRVTPLAWAMTRQVRDGALPWGRWLRAHARPDTRVASLLPGSIAYASGLRVIDLTGLLTPEAGAVRHANGDRALIEGLAMEPLGRPDYVVDRGPSERELRGRSPYARAFETLGARDGLTFYRVHWDVADSLRR